ncbi:hypothetical protein [Wolbachia endosymbiont of Dactylopius coccus]
MGLREDWIPVSSTGMTSSRSSLLLLSSQCPDTGFHPRRQCLPSPVIQVA